MLRLPARQHHPVATGLLLAALAGCAESQGPTPALSTVYCCRTLVDVNCYTRPDAGRSGQLVHVHLCDPLDRAWSDRWLGRAGAWP
jgi:hypothetical protein